MSTVRELFEYINKKAPVSLQISGDNIGLLTGRWDAQVTKVLVALDITLDVIDECKAWGGELILSHHPVIYEKVGRITDADFTGVRILTLNENRIAAICMHTNLDVANGGVNDTLAEQIGLKKIRTIIDPSLSADKDRGVCRKGMLPEPMTIEAFALHIRAALGANGLKYVPGDREVKNVAVGGGACGSDLPLVAAEGCDTFVTADIKHSHMLEAQWYGINLIDAGHFPTEDVICPVLVRWLAEGFPELRVKKADCQRDPARYISQS